LGAGLSPNNSGSAEVVCVDRQKQERILFDELRERVGKCWICESTENLNVHHIDLNRENNDSINLVVVCKRCHGKIHFLLQRMEISPKDWVLDDLRD